MSRTLWVWQLLPLAMIVLLAMGVPTDIAGWGPREWPTPATAETMGATRG